MISSEEFLEYINPRNLYLGALFFIFLTLIVVAMIYAYLSVRKRRYFAMEKMDRLLNYWVSEAVVEGSAAEVAGLLVKLRRNFNTTAQRTHVTDNLIRIKKNFTGSVTDQVVYIYEQLGLKNDSLKKLHSLKWHIQARGIYELCMMNQADCLPDIWKYTNSGNEQVRMEAQTAIIGLQGFAGLAFLNDLTYPMNEWQQIKLLEQLRALDPGDMEHLPQWLSSPNQYVVLFALRLADIYQQLQVHDEVVLCLQSPDEKIRRQAIRTIGRLANDQSARILTKQYGYETDNNKQQILKQLGIIGSETDLPYLAARLKEESDTLKLEAGRAMTKCAPDGINMLLQLAHGDEVLLSVSRQIKYEMNK